MRYACWQKGLDPNRDKYPYFYYRHTMPWGTGGWYNAPGYAGNGLPVSMPGFFQSIMLAPVEANPVHPYTYAHSPAVGRKLNENFMAPMDEGGSLMLFGIDCEVGKVFPLCVGVAGLGHRLWDALQGTQTQVGYQRYLNFSKTWVFGGNANPEDPYTWGTVYYDRDINVPLNQPQNDMPCFWTTVAYNTTPFETEWPAKILRDCLAIFGQDTDGGGLAIRYSPHIAGPLTLDDQWGQAFAIATAYELGDTETYERLKDYVDAAWEPKHSNGEFGYHFNLGEAWPRGIINHILGFSAAGGPGSTARMYNQPNTAKFSQPTLSGVDYPNVTVRQAAYDEGRRALAIAICPGQDASPIGSPTTLTVTNLPESGAKVTLDGQPCDSVVDKGDGTLQITTTIGEHTILVSV